MKKSQPLKTSPNENQFKTNNTPLCPRLERLAIALFENSKTSRELFTIIPSNNPPAYVNRLRSEYGLSIPCLHESFVTIDGFKSWFGRYHLTEADRQKLEPLLNADGGAYEN